MNAPTPNQLDLVFGGESTGDTPEARAASSERTFVRSQSQLSVWSEGAKGLRLNARSALALVGFGPLLQAVEEGAIVLNPTLDEPASTLRAQRESLDLTIEEIAAATGLTVADITQAEQRGAITPIRKLKHLSQMLGLDDDRLSVAPNAGADHELAVRLRTLKGRQRARLSASLVLKLAESAWIVAKERQIASMLGDHPHLLNSFERSNDYAQPTWRRGYELAERARQLLEIDPLAPIPSIRRVAERLRIPLIQADLGQVFAGATVENANHRGIVVNTQGDNQNVWVRRMTLCHELGHLLWDPTHRLERLHVDRYSEIQAPQPEPVESRANAFAIAFLAPRDAVLAIIQKHSNAATMLAELMSTYGIAATAAKYHLANVALEWGTPIDTTRVRSTLLPIPDDDWQVHENWTIDFFQPGSTPISRRGRFAGVIAVAAMSKIITLDQAASYLSVASDDLDPYLRDIAQMTAPDLL